MPPGHIRAGCNFISLFSYYSLSFHEDILNLGAYSLIFLCNTISFFNTQHILIIMPYVVAGLGTDLLRYPNTILLDILKNNFPNPLNTTIRGAAGTLTIYDTITETGDIRFELTTFLENTDYQISVMDESVPHSKKKQSIGQNALYEFWYKPTIHIWVRQNTDTRPTEIDDIKTTIDDIITANESTFVEGLDTLEAQPAIEIPEREFRTNEDEDLEMQSIWHIKIPVMVRVFKWWT